MTAHTTQVRGAPTSDQKLQSPRNRESIRRYILERWMHVERQKVVVAVTRKKSFSVWLRQSGLPDNVIVEDLDVSPNSLDMAAALKRYETDLSIWAVIAL